MTRTKLIAALDGWHPSPAECIAAKDMLEADAIAMQQAVEALEYRGMASWRVRQPAIAILKEALNDRPH